MAKPKQDKIAWLASISGELSSETLRQLDKTLPWYREMPAARRASVGLVAQSGIGSFLAWYENPKSQPWVAADVFGLAPRELLKSISLQQTLQLTVFLHQIVEILGDRHTGLALQTQTDSNTSIRTHGELSTTMTQQSLLKYLLGLPRELRLVSS